MRWSLAVFVCAAAMAAAGIGQAQNLLVNGDLEASPTTYFDGSDPSIADDVPGWNIFLGAADGSYVLVSYDSSGNTIDLDMGVGPAGGGIETAVASRPAVTPGLLYKATVTYDNYFNPTLAAYYIDWFDGGGSLISSTGGLLPDPNGAFGYDPYNQLVGVSGSAPVGAASAGVRFVSGNPGYNGLAADNFSLTKIPEPTSLGLMVLAGLSLLGYRGYR